MTVIHTQLLSNRISLSTYSGSHAVFPRLNVVCILLRLLKLSGEMYSATFCILVVKVEDSGTFSTALTFRQLFLCHNVLA